MRRSTGDVVGGLPPEKSRGLRGGPARRQRTEVDRIRSCCQGWTGLDDCCEEHGQVAPGGREGSGSTRQRLATRGPSSIQRATPARGLPSLRFYAVGSSLFLLSVCFCLCFLFYRDDDLCWLLPCPSFYVCFSCLSPIPGLIWFGSFYLVISAGFVADQLM